MINKETDHTPTTARLLRHCSEVNTQTQTNKWGLAKNSPTKTNTEEEADSREVFKEVS